MMSMAIRATDPDTGFDCFAPGTEGLRKYRSAWFELSAEPLQVPVDDFLRNTAQWTEFESLIQNSDELAVVVELHRRGSSPVARFALCRTETLQNNVSADFPRSWYPLAESMCIPFDRWHGPIVPDSLAMNMAMVLTAQCSNRNCRECCGPQVAEDSVLHAGYCKVVALEDQSPDIHLDGSLG